MNNQTRPISTQFLFVFAIAVGALLTPPVAKSQTYWLQYSMTVGSTDSGTQNNAYNSGQVQTDNLLTTNLLGPGDVASASATPSASFGLLSVIANCSVDDSSWNGYGHIARFASSGGGEGPVVDFQDQLTFNSTTLPTGTYVQIQIVCEVAGYITPEAGSEPNFTTSIASVDLFDPSRRVSTTIGGDYVTNSISIFTTNYARVGYSISFGSSISAYGWAEADATPGFVGSVSTEITAQTYVNVLTPGVSYTSASGTVYPTLQLPPPVLNIQATNNTVVISWPSVYANYALEQNSSLNPATWSNDSDPVTQAGSQNQVTISFPSGTVFYRLQEQ